MSSKYPTIQQHEPLRAPSSWGAQEKRFVAQLEEILDDIYRRFGRLKMTDLGDALRQTLKSTDGAVSELTQTSKTFTTAFESIGALGKQKGVTQINEHGLIVTHTAIGGKTQISADGMRMYDAAGNIIGGTYKRNGKVASVSQELYNPSSPYFNAAIGEMTGVGEHGEGIEMRYNNQAGGSVGVYTKDGENAAGAYLIGKGEVVIATADARYVLRFAGGMSVLDGKTGAGIEFGDDGYGYIHFLDNGGKMRKLSLAHVYEAVNAVFPD